MRISNLSNKSGNPSSSDYLVLDDGTTVTKIDYNKLAKAIIENYAGSTVAGSAQSVKAALDSLNSKTTQVIAFGSFNSKADAFKAMCNSLYNNAQYATTFGAVFTGAASGTYIVSAVVTASAIRFIASYSTETYVGQHVRSSDALSYYKVSATAQ